MGCDRLPCALPLSCSSTMSITVLFGRSLPITETASSEKQWMMAYSAYYPQTNGLIKHLNWVSWDAVHECFTWCPLPFRTTGHSMTPLNIQCFIYCLADIAFCHSRLSFLKLPVTLPVQLVNLSTSDSLLPGLPLALAYQRSFALVAYCASSVTSITHGPCFFCRLT